MTHTPTPPRHPSRYLGLSCLVVGAVFLFDPFIVVFDVLPDCLGFLLISIGLCRLADMNERLADASRDAGRLALLGVARFLALFLTFGLVSPTEQPVFILLVLFSLGLLDILVLIPMWRNFEGGLTYLAARNGATTLLDHRTHSRRGGTHSRTRIERYAAFSLFYFILREALVIIPELTVLTHEKGGVEWGGSHLYDAVGLFRLVGCGISCLVGLIWLVKTVSFVHCIKRDKPFIDALHRKYETEVLVRDEMFATRAVKASLVALAAAAFLTLDVYFEGVNILPDSLSAILLLLSIIFLRRYSGRNRSAMIATILYGLSATVSWILQLRYFRITDTTEIPDDDRLFARWQVMSTVQAITAILFILALFLILRALYALAKRYTGLRALREGSTYAMGRNESIHRRIRKKLITVGVFGVLTALSTLVHWCVVPNLPPLDFIGPGHPSTIESLFYMLYDGIREAYWFIDLAIGALFGIFTIHANSEIFEQMDYSNMMN